MKKKKQQKPEVKNTHLEFNDHLLENEVWLTIDQAMKHLNVSRSTLYRLRKQHSIPNFKLGKIPIFPKHLLNKLFMHKALSNLNDNKVE